ncbi:TPA: 50S ribosomal protein L21e [Candidatus Woesearchaeota archaeon]|nr:50S ribosomal protein L21e [Candidatus Woesearchaeota archaeon]
MVKRIGTARRKTRHLFSVSRKMKGKIAVSGFVRKFGIGELVALVAQPAIVKGMYFRRFHGRTGTVVGMQGKCYQVSVSDRGVKKTLIVGPIHLRKAYGETAWNQK